MAGGGFVQLPDGSVIVALTLPVPLAHARTHAERGTGAATGVGTGTDRATDTGSGRGTGTETATRSATGLVPGPSRQLSRGGPFDGALPTPRRRWSAHADEAHPVRMATAYPHGDEPRVRVLVHALNRARALTRLRNLGLRAVYLRGNAEPPTADEITAVLHHPDGLVWRTTPDDDRESWHPIESLLDPTDRVRTG